MSPYARVVIAKPQRTGLSHLCGMKKIKSMVVNSYYQDVGSVINLKLVTPLKKNILKIYCNVLFLLTEWIFCYWDTQFYLHFEHLNKKTTIPECSFLLIHVLFEKWDEDKKRGSNNNIIADKLENILLRSG